MAEFRVKWGIDIEADTPLEAAEKALLVQRDPNSTALVFEVCTPKLDPGGPGDLIDLTRDGIAAVDKDGCPVKDPCPECGAPLAVCKGGGVACTKCKYWFCY